MSSGETRKKCVCDTTNALHILHNNNNNTVTLFSGYSLTFQKGIRLLPLDFVEAPWCSPLLSDNTHFGRNRSRPKTETQISSEKKSTFSSRHKPEPRPTTTINKKQIDKYLLALTLLYCVLLYTISAVGKHFSMILLCVRFPTAFQFFILLSLQVK